MARIGRSTQKIFAGSASNNGVFGSAQDNTKVLTNNVETLQSKPAWASGWLSAIIGARKFPPLEEFQALHYITTSQIAYLFQEGIPEWDDGTTYYQKSIVKQTGTYQLYGSLVDNNTNNPLSDATKWQPLIDISATVAQATTSVYGTTRLATEADFGPTSTSDDVVTAALGSQHGFVTGDYKFTGRRTLQPGWIWGVGQIGNAASGASNRANVDTYNLFVQCWTDYPYSGTTANFANGELQVYDSTGVAIARGATADVDWNNNCRIAVPDWRGRVPAGRDDMNGTAAGRLTGQPGGVNGLNLGGSGGAETNVLTQTNLPNVTLLSNVDGGPAGQGGTPRDKRAYQYSGVRDGGQDTIPLGGNDTPHNNVQPTKICNIVIKL